MKRSCGILLPISALPSPYGIGTLGKAARAFVDFLKEAGQSWWQILPVGPTSYGDSPYQSFSSYAGNPYFIDLDTLREEGLLTQEEIDAFTWGEVASRVDYEKLYNGRFSLLETATARGWALQRPEIEVFEKENPWLADYALFMALKRHFGMLPWTQWPEEDARLRRPKTLQKYRLLLSDDIRLFTYMQFLFFRQWKALRAYAHQNGIRILGDLPIYVAMDSADVWAEPQFFQLDSQGAAKAVAGVPPDYFSQEGQLWGNPLYDWDKMKADGYGWWIRRIHGAGKLYDTVRIDHFRAFESYWAVPAEAETAKSGAWKKGPGMDLLQVLLQWFPEISFVAEDLGLLTSAVEQLLEDSGLPGMKVLSFAFDSEEPGAYVPHNHIPNSVCYTGTHDNTPLGGWLEEADPKSLQRAMKYLGVKRKKDLPEAMLRAGMASVSNLFIAQMQDYLGLGAEARINTPGTPAGNWQWRLEDGMLTGALAEKLAALAARYGRM